MPYLRRGLDPSGVAPPGAGDDCYAPYYRCKFAGIRRWFVLVRPMKLWHWIRGCIQETESDQPANEECRRSRKATYHDGLKARAPTIDSRIMPFY